MGFFDKLRKQKVLSFTLILFTLSIGVVIGTLINTGVKAAKEQAAAPGATALVIPNPVQLSTAFSQLAKQMEASVVNISSTYVQKMPQQSRNRRRSPIPDDEDGEEGMQDFFFRFFGNPFGGGGGGNSPDMGTRKGSSLGSGVVVDKNGYILTNNHVVEKADRVQVKFSGDPTEYDAKVIGTDAPTDLAVIKISASKPLIPAKIGNSDAVNVGDWAVAIGSPFGFQATVTAGIISAKERDVRGESSQFQHFLQTDAAINPGNSGGPLLNINGEVIGINTAIATRTGGYQGIGFAMPINTAAKVYNQIIKSGKVTRGSIGIRFSGDASRDLLRAYGASEGIFIQAVAPGGPAEKAGLKAADIIIAIDGKPVKSGSELVERVTETPIGNTLTITVLRNEKKQDFKVTVADLTQVFPDQYGARRSEEESGKAEGTEAKFGIKIEGLTDARRQSLGFKEKGGVLISEVTPNSFAEDIGLQPGQIIVSINRQPVNSVDDVKRIQNTLKPGDAVAFHVMSPGGGRNREWSGFFAAGTLPNTPQ